MEIITSTNFDDRVIHGKGLVIADFYSDTCMPCKRLAPIFGELSDEYTKGVSFVKINTASDRELAINLGIMAVPTIIFFLDGEEKERVVGFVSKEELRMVINRFLPDQEA